MLKVSFAPQEVLLGSGVDASKARVIGFRSCTRPISRRSTVSTPGVHGGSSGSGLLGHTRLYRKMPLRASCVRTVRFLDVEKFSRNPSYEKKKNAVSLPLNHPGPPSPKFGK